MPSGWNWGVGNPFKKRDSINVTVTLDYGLFNSPHTKRINQKIRQANYHGYELVNRQDNNVGCLGSIMWKRGHTVLTFRRIDQ